MLNFVIQMWGTKIDVLFLSSLVLRKVDSLHSLRNKIFVCILIFLAVCILISQAFSTCGKGN